MHLVQDAILVGPGRSRPRRVARAKKPTSPTAIVKSFSPRCAKHRDEQLDRFGVAVWRRQAEQLHADLQELPRLRALGLDRAVDVLQVTKAQRRLDAGGSASPQVARSAPSSRNAA